MLDRSRWAGLVLLYYTLQMMDPAISFNSAENAVANGYPNSFIDEVEKISKIVPRSVNDALKAQVKTSLAFIDEHLAATNEFRSKHSAGNLELDYQLCLDAEGYAKTLIDKSIVAKKVIVEHDPHLKYSQGENILGGQNYTRFTGKFVAEYWYNESEHHNWAPNIFNKTTGHFTQIIWKSTTHLGVGQFSHEGGATDKNFSIIVARYYPAGNWAYQKSFTENVFPVG